ncbi:hypothetical protein JHK85_012225 [Glycine max]|nr:hypothetical protein JHK87_011787 [Glycine soja]KAG5039749.1 hypothetical protein JHK85_012225 [Glycine max]
MNKEETTVQFSHPWPKWVQLMKCLLDNGYLSHEEVKMFRNVGMSMKDCNVIRIVCHNFCRYHFHLLSSYRSKVSL